MPKAKKPVEPPVCPYCDAVSVRVTGEAIYGKPAKIDRRKYHDAFFWRCPNCRDAYVGCHPGSDRPMGRLADAELRQWKSALHRLLDSLWKGPTAIMSRTDAYRNLAVMMKVRADECHVGMFNVEQCQMAIELLKKGPKGL